MLLRSVLFGALIAVTLVYWPIDAAEPAGGASPALVQIYTTRTCAYCRALRRYLAVRGIPFTDYDIETNRSARLAFEASGARGVPFVVIGAQRIHGFNPVALEQALAAVRGAASTPRQPRGG